MVLAGMVASTLGQIVKGLESNSEFQDVESRPMERQMTHSHELTSKARNIKTVAWSVFALLLMHNAWPFF